MKKKNSFRGFKSIKTTIVFSFSALIISTLVIFSVISINYTENATMSNSMDYTLKLINQVTRDIDSYIDYMENISSLVVHSSDVQKYLFEESSESEKDELRQRILTQFNTVVETREDIANIAVIAPNGKSMINEGTDTLNEYNLDYYLESIAGKEISLSSSHVQNLIRNHYKWVITLSRSIGNPYTTKQAGVFFIDLNYRVIRDLCENNSLGSSWYIFIIDEDGKIIYHPKQQLIYYGLKEERIKQVLSAKGNHFIEDENGESRLYTMSASKKTGWTVVGVASNSDLVKSKQETLWLYIYTALILLLAAVLLAALISAAVTRPILRLKNSMKEVERGNFEDANIVEISQNEIGSLSKSFNIMTTEIKNLMEQNTHVQEQKRLMELQALQAQINPHFLYNTLDSIIWMAEGNRSEEVIIMTSSLARLLRQSISNESELTPVKQEASYVESYLTIQKMRYKDKLEFEVQMEPSILEEQIIKLILQPIVENAIYHGIKYIPHKGLIRVTGWREGNCILFEILDNGRGMEKEVLDQILKEKKSSIHVRNGVGVWNVQMRLQLYYGPEYGLSYESRPGEGTRVTVRIPVNKVQKSEEGGHESQ